MSDRLKREVEANSYSDLWFAVFLESIRPDQSAREARFLMEQLPFPAFRTVLDVCCGEGRHTQLLAAAGYSVTGIDLSPFIMAGGGAYCMTLRLDRAREVAQQAKRAAS